MRSKRRLNYTSIRMMILRIHNFQLYYIDRLYSMTAEASECGDRVGAKKKKNHNEIMGFIGHERKPKPSVVITFLEKN